MINAADLVNNSFSRHAIVALILQSTTQTQTLFLLYHAMLFVVVVHLPVPIPAKNLAAMSIPAPFAKMVSSQFSIKGMARMRMVGRRPAFCARTPTGRAEIAAPMARMEDTREPGKKKERRYKKSSTANLVRRSLGIEVADISYDLLCVCGSVLITTSQILI